MCEKHKVGNNATYRKTRKHHANRTKDDRMELPHRAKSKTTNETLEKKKGF
jgi:hypothetical protein